MTHIQQTTYLILTLALMAGLIYILIQALVSEKLMAEGKSLNRKTRKRNLIPWPEFKLS